MTENLPWVEVHQLIQDVHHPLLCFNFDVMTQTSQLQHKCPGRNRERAVHESRVGRELFYKPPCRDEDVVAQYPEKVR